MAYIVYDPDASSFVEQSYLNMDDRPPHCFQAGLIAANEGVKAVKKQLQGEFEDESQILPPPSSKETVSVYLRVKPKTLEESQFSSMSSVPSMKSNSDDGKCPEDTDTDDDDDDEITDIVDIESQHQVALIAPKQSNTYKNSMNGAGKLTHRYSFTKIFGPTSTQKEIFEEMVLPRMQCFLEGQNQLIFTYGASSSGKTYTIQGTNDDPGIIPRALDVIFNTIQDQQMETLELKPNCFNRVILMKDKDIRKLEADKQEVLQLAVDLQSQLKKHHESSKLSGISKLSADSIREADVLNMSQESFANLFPELVSRFREESQVDIKHDDINYSVWISFAEIYNENIHDLLEKVPEPKRKGDKPRRIPLKLAEDKNGSIYIKGLKEIKVNSADEAYQVMMIGRENLHFAATRLNHHSSRSHCIFTIKVIRVAKTDKPHLARVSMLSFCDLAGSERIKKTLNTGERQKEAGNINTSLLVLGRCMKAIRHNQTIKDSKKQQVVPFRDSKLTRLFQSFLVGHGKASMVVNVSQAPYLFDESIQVLKFAAIASKISIQEKIKTPETVKPNRRRQTRFSMMVDAAAKRPDFALLGRSSIEWEKPVSRSTEIGFPQLPVGANEVETTTMEDEQATYLEETMIDQRYEKLVNLVDHLKDLLFKERAEKYKIEKEVRAELCQEFNVMMIETENQWEQRLKDERKRAEELADWQIETMQKALHNRKRPKRDSNKGNETVFFQKEELEIELEERQSEIQILKDTIEAMKEAQSELLDENKKLQQDVTKRTFENESDRQKASKLEKTIEDLKSELERSKEVQVESAKNGGNEVLVNELQKNIADQEEKISTLESEKDNLKELLNEASEDFIEKEKDLKKAVQKVKELEEKMMKQNLEKTDLKCQMEELQLMLNDVNNRLEEKEKNISEMEEASEQMEKELIETKKRSLHFSQEKSDLLEQIKELKEDKLARIDALEKQEELKHELEEKSIKIKELEEELESLKMENDKCPKDIEGSNKAEQEIAHLRKIIEEKDSTLRGNEKEILSLENETKSLIQAEKHQREVNNQLRKELEIMQKQVKDLNAKTCSKLEMERLQKLNSDQSDEIKRLNERIETLRREETAFMVLNEQLEARSEEKATLESKLEKIQADLEAKEYDLKRVKEEKEKLMNHFDHQLKKKSEELAVEKRESLKLREVMSRSTPNKNQERDGEELKSLKEENLKLKKDLRGKGELIKKLQEEEKRKTEMITSLERMIPAKKTMNFSSEEDEDEREKEDMKMELMRKQKEIEEMKEMHTKELEKVTKATDKIINLYREENILLQKNTHPSHSSSSNSVASTLEQDDSTNDTSIVEETPVKSRKRRRVKNTSRSNSSKTSDRTADSIDHASFEDSNIENDDTFHSGNEYHLRRSSRLKRSRPVRKKPSTSSPSEKTDNGILKEVSNSQALDVIKEEPPRESLQPPKTPANKKKSLLMNANTPAAQFSPTESSFGTSSPRTVVRRQLRSRKKKKN